jgi:serine/threonine protein kinase
MGVVYEAWDRDRRTKVALKTLRHLEPKALLRFKNEFRALADLQHDNLVRLGELFADDNAWYFTMELVEGQDFLSWVRGRQGSSHDPPTEEEVSGVADTQDGFTLRASGPMRTLTPAQVQAAGALALVAPPYDEERLRDALAQLGRGVAALHAIDKVHRDIKPSNVLVTATGRVVLLDFGLITDSARGKPDTETQIVGTAAYMAPEQAASRPVGPEADWYGVGAMLYESLTGQPPFQGAPLEILMDKQRREPPAPRELMPLVPADLDAMCVELLRRRPEERLAGASALSRLGVHDLPPAAPAMYPHASITQHQPFVGREAELAELRAAWQACRSPEESHAVTMFVHGESGIGKSSLVRRFLRDLEADEPTALVLTSRCYEREALPYKAFDGLVDALSRHLSRMDPVEAALFLPHDAAILARLFPVVRRIPAMARVGEVRVQSPQELRTRAFSALRDLLSRLCESRPVALFIDDFQWADKDSLALFAHLMYGQHAPPLLLCATMRDDVGGATTGASPPEEGAMRGELSGDTRHIELHGLADDEARGLVELLAPGRRMQNDTIAAEAEGHPLFLQELVRHVGGSGPGSGTTTGAPNVRLDDALWARVDSLEQPARQLIEVIAIAGEPILPIVAMDAAGVDPGQGGMLLGLLRAAHLVRSTGGRAGDLIECYHDRVRESVSARLGAATARQHHAALAGALESAGSGAGASPQVLVRHLEAAGETARAAAQAELAARRAAELLAFDRAGELYRTALRLGKHAGEDRRRLQIELGDSLVNAGRGAEAADVFLAAAEGADSATRLECRRKAAEHLLGTGQIQRGIEALAGVLAEFGESFPATPERALTSLVWLRLRLKLRGLGWKPRDPSEISARELSRIDVYRAVAVGLGMVDNVRGADFQARGLLASLAVGEPSRVARAFGLEAAYVGMRGGRHTVRAQKFVDETTRLAESSGEPFLRAWSLGAGSIVKYLAGDFHASIEMATTSETIYVEETTGTAWETATVRIFGSMSMRYAGRYRHLRRLYDEHVPEAERRGDRYTEATLTRVANTIWLCADVPDVASEDLGRRAWRPPVGAYHMQNWYEWRALAEIALYKRDPHKLLGEVEITQAALERSMLARVQTVKAEAVWLEGRLALAVAEMSPAQRPVLIARALRSAKRLARLKMPYSTVWADLLRAGAAYLGGHPGDATEHLRAVIKAAETTHLESCGAAAQLALGGLVRGDAGVELMTAGRPRLAREGVRDAEKFAHMLAPGFEKED